MPIPREFNTAAEELRRLIQESKLPLKQIAAIANVSYDSLWKWYNRKQPEFGLLAGEQVYYALTGRTFLKSFRATR